MNIGIFDSGSGGRFVAAKLSKILPNHNYRVIDDRAHAPYGERSYDDIRQLTFTAIQPLLDCDIIALACNTATAAAINDLRSAYPDKIFVGFEPMIKPAAARSVSRHITLLATKATAYSKRTEELIDLYASDLTIDRIGTIDWARKIDSNETDKITLDVVAESVKNNSDTIIIGCTHYIALMPRLEKLFPDVTILEPTEAIARHIESLVIAHQLQQ
jgi:Glutamate racemase